MKVMIIESYSAYDFSYQINGCLSRHHPSEIVDIKYACNKTNSRDYYSAMIIFQEAEV